jgi:hypothetical protein
LNVEITNADFGKIAINGEAERTLTLNGSLLTKPVSLAIEGEGAEHFTLASNSVTPTDGTITDAKIKIYYQPAVEGTHTATLKITSDELTAQTITLTGNAVEEYTVHFYLNGEEQTELAKTILSGNKLDALPKEPESCDPLTYPTFAGWKTTEIVGATDTKPTMLDLSTPITSDCNYYAVFEKGTTFSGSTTSAIMKYTGGTTTDGTIAISSSNEITFTLSQSVHDSLALADNSVQKGWTTTAPTADNLVAFNSAGAAVDSGIAITDVNTDTFAPIANSTIDQIVAGTYTPTT